MTEMNDFYRMLSNVMWRVSSAEWKILCAIYLLNVGGESLASYRRLRNLTGIRGKGTISRALWGLQCAGYISHIGSGTNGINRYELTDKGEYRIFEFRESEE